MRWVSPAETVLGGGFDGVMLPNGPGDPPGPSARLGGRIGKE